MYKPWNQSEERTQMGKETRLQNGNNGPPPAHQTVYRKKTNCSDTNILFHNRAYRLLLQNSIIGQPQ